MNQEGLQELFVGQIRDIYDAEKQLVKALPKLAKAAQSEELSEAIRNHLSETEGQVSRLVEVFSMVGVAAKGKPCKAMKGLLEEGDEAIREQDKGPLRDLALIAGAQRVEHYEMAAYGTVRTIAEQLGLEEAASLLQETEDEEKQADSKLTDVAAMLYESLNLEVDAEEDDESDKEPVAAGSARVTRAGATSKPSRKTSR